MQASREGSNSRTTPWR